ncbi:MAG TPA: RagB/SusD family nutrient uptake outer membrane protein, partial [Pelobium sp.]|nr:RagB/SusD family nutrient uptake outer membrane protein [Pelobium sp.]
LAHQYAQDVYTNSGYTLIRPYRDLFLAATESAARSEMMMLVQAGPGGNNEYILAAFLNGPRGNVANAGGTYGWMRPVIDLYDKYNANDPRKAHNFSGNIRDVNPVVINGLTYFTPDPVNANFGNLNLAKYREADPSSKTSRGISSFAGETDFGILRFADIILILAETRFKKGDELGARALLREVRLRACEDNLTKLNQITTAYFKPDFMQELMDERSRELCGEGWRRFDLIRTNTLKSTVENLRETGSPTNVQNVPEIKLNFEDHKIFYPIPTRERELNKNLTQNEGYPVSLN